MNKFALKEVFLIHGGNSGLTEKVIYKNQSINDEDNIAVYSSATEDDFFLPKVNKNLKIDNREIKTFSSEKSYILITRNGKAGLMRVIENKSFTINDHAYVMELKRAFCNKVNLHFFVKRYQKEFLDFVTSKTSNGTFSKEIAENYEVEIPDIDLQNQAMVEYNNLVSLKNKLESMIKLIDEQLNVGIKL